MPPAIEAANGGRTYDPSGEAWPLFAAAMQRLGPWGAGRRVAVAVSGGPDSLCLAYLARRWGDPLGLIVDHGLRDGSAEEASEAASRLAAMGIVSRILTLRGLARGAGLPERARQARYAALSEAVAEAGLADLLLGHHADDQAETVLMRGLAGSGPDGLAGMAAVVETLSCRLVRPLLGHSTRQLRGLLEAAGIGWAEDPGNRDPASLRARLRRSLQDDPGETQALLGQAERNARAREVRGAAVAGSLAARAALFGEGFAILSPGVIGADALAALLRSLTGSAYPARTVSIARMAANPHPGTVGGVRFLPAGRYGPGLLLVRETAAMQAPVAAVPGAAWDRRFRVAPTSRWCPGVTVGALGGEAARFRRGSRLPAAVLQTLPAFRMEGRVLAVPHLGTALPDVSDYFNGWTLLSGGVTLQPQTPACGAPFARLHGG